MNPLLAFALLFCPHEFRTEYQDQIAADALDAAECGGGVFLALCANVAWNGIILRLESFWNNLHFASRLLRKAPVFTIVVILTLGIGIGLNVALFALVDTVLLKPLPYDDPQRLVFVGIDVPKYWWLSYPEARDVAEQTRTLRGLALSAGDRITMNGVGETRRLTGRIVSGPYFQTLGAHAHLGRMLDESDAGKRTLLISYTMWERDFHGNPTVLGRVVMLDGKAYTLVGVAPRGLRDPKPNELVSSDYWLPLDPAGPLARYRGDFDLVGIARLRDGTSMGAAIRDTKRVFDNLARRYPANHRLIYSPSSRTLVPMQSSIAADVAPALLMLYGAVFVVLLIACSNVANMQLIRSLGRNREFVVRRALGAGRSAVAGQLLCEAALLACGGAVAGIGLAAVCLRAAGALFAPVLSQWSWDTFDARITAYALALAVVVTCIVGLLPILRTPRSIADDLKAAWRADDSKSTKQLRSAFVSAQVALAIALMVAAGLLIRSYSTLVRVDVGFTPAGAYAVTVPSLPENRYPTPRARLRFAQQLAEQIASVPGVGNAAIAEDVPFQDTDMSTFSFPATRLRHALIKSFGVSADFFRTLGVPLVRGRFFDRRERAQSAPVALVNKAFVRTYFPGGTIVGQRIRLERAMPADAPTPLRTIVGVIGNVRESLASPPAPVIYVPITQLPSPNSIIVRAQGSRAALASAVKRLNTRLDPLLPAPEVVSLPTLVDADAARTRLSLVLFTVLATIALLLAILGMYSVSSYAVSERMHDLGVRMAIGATSAQIAKSVLFESVGSGLAGVCLGIVLAADSTRLIAALLFAISPLDAGTFVAVVLVALLGTVTSAVLPAIRASRLDAARALHYE